MLYADQWGKAKTTRLEDLLRKGRQRQIVSDDELKAFQHLRDVRNAYAHYRDIKDQSAWIRRAINEDMPLEDVLETDASQAVESLGSFLRRRAGVAALLEPPSPSLLSLHDPSRSGG